LKKPKG